MICNLQTKKNSIVLIFRTPM